MFMLVSRTDSKQLAVFVFADARWKTIRRNPITAFAKQAPIDHEGEALAEIIRLLPYSNDRIPVRVVVSSIGLPLTSSRV